MGVVERDHTLTSCVEMMENLEEVFDQLSSVFSKVRDYKDEQAKSESTMAVSNALIALDLTMDYYEYAFVLQINAQMPLHKSGVMNIMKLRQLNRTYNLNCKERREKTQDKKSDIDELHLQLQNLQYEVMHLQKETTNCLEFK